MDKIYAVFCVCFRNKTEDDEKNKRKEMTNHLMDNSSFLFANTGPTSAPTVKTGTNLKEEKDTKKN